MVKRRAARPEGGETENPNGETAPRSVRRGDIFWAYFPVTGETVKQGRRPALVVQNDMGNLYGPSVIVSPVTSRLSQKQYPINVVLPEGLLPKDSEVRLNQVITIDKSRLGAWIARTPAEVMARVDEALRISLGLPRFE